MDAAQNWTEISSSALTHNLATLREAAGADTEVLAVIKADAYGHGAERCAPVLVAAGARWLGVTHAAEGARVRRALASHAGAEIQPPEILSPAILVMCGPLPQDAALCAEHALTPVLWTPEQAALFAGTHLGVHVEIDTGMSRQGARPGREVADLLAALSAHGLRLDGIFTHFSSAEVAGSETTAAQQRRFEQAIQQVAAAGFRPRWIHAGNSSAVDNPVTPAGWLVELAASLRARAMVRTGLALYGYALPIAGAAEPQVRPRLQPVLRWLARVLAVRQLEPGDSVGYNAAWTAPRDTSAPTRVALLGVGYADGLRRELSSSDTRPGGWVMLAGRRATILGRVSMNLTVVDVSDLPGVRPGDIATLLGPGVSAEDHARLAGTISYEILCGVHPCQ